MKKDMQKPVQINDENKLIFLVSNDSNTGFTIKYDPSNMQLYRINRDPYHDTQTTIKITFDDFLKVCLKWHDHSDQFLTSDRFFTAFTKYLNSYLRFTREFWKLEDN